MPTATLHIDDVHGYGGVMARCYRLDPPRPFGQQMHGYVTVWIVARTHGVDATVHAVPATEFGSPAEGTLKARIGSFTLDGDPEFRPDYIDGCFAWSLASMGGYQIVSPPPDSEPQPPAQPEGAA